MLLKQKTTALLLIIFLFSLNAISQLPQAQIDSIVRELAKAKEDTNKVNILKTLGNEVGYNDLKKALEYAYEGYELSKKLNYQTGIGNLAYLIGILYDEEGQYPLSDSFLNIAESKFQMLGLSNQLAKVGHSRGVRHYRLGNYWLAADHFAKAVKFFEESKDEGTALIAYQSLIAVLGQIKNHDKAIESGKKALKLAEKLKDTLSMGYSLQALVTDLIYSKRLDEAGTYVSQLHEFAEKTLDKSLAAECYGTLGMYDYERKNISGSLFYFQKALEVAKQFGNNYQVANHLNSLGQSQLELGMLSESRKNLIESLKFAKDFDNKRAEYNASLSLSTYFKKVNDHKNAYDHLFHHLEMKDSILKTETSNYTTYLEESYQANKRENEILRLQKVEQEKEFALKKRNTYLAIGAGLILVLIVILYLLRRNSLHKQKLARQQSDLLEEKIKTIEKEQQISSLQSMINGQETERTRIAKDLHDGLGGIFSTVKMHYSTLQQNTPVITENPLYKKTLDLINNASDELRKVAHNMMPEVLMKVGLVEALQDFCNNISSGKLLKITLQTFGMEKRLGSATEIMLYRIIQELINNIIKHADATEALIQINREGNRLSLVIEDNGKGFDTKEAEEKRSMGIATVKSRVDYLNGRLTIDSRKDIGTTVMIDLLINE